METTTQLMIPDIAKNIDTTVLQVIGENAIVGFQRAYLLANATAQLHEMLTPEYMEPIMKLQGSRLGFRTDKDKSGGYDMNAVKSCLIDAVLQGVQPTGNQFNIIAGNMYITKEGYHYLLSKIPGLRYQITFELPRVKDSSAAIVALIKWSINGSAERSEKLDIPIRVNAQMGTDAIIGKATRKARHWLHATITGQDTGDGDVENAEATVISSKPIQKTEDQLEAERIAMLLSDCKTPDDVQRVAINNPDIDVELIKKRIEELGGHK